jgi:general secretion pathway protein J
VRSRRLPRSAVRSAGFTLLELLITVALTGMLTIVLFGGLRFGTRAWEAAETSADGRDKVLATQAVLTDLVSVAYPFYIGGAPKEGHVAFDGGPESVTFLAPAKSPRGALQRVTIKTAELNGSRTLAVWTALELRPGSQPRLSAILLSGVKSFDIDYYGSDTIRDQPSWRSSWQGYPTMPMLVRIRATFNNRRMNWPDLVIATHISVDQGCTYDQLTNYCQGRI